MAEIMDTKKDDLALKDKIKQVRDSKMIVWLSPDTIVLNFIRPFTVS